MHKALDRIKYLKKKPGPIGAEPADLDKDDFASIEARINPKDAKAEPKAQRRRADGADATSDAERRSGTAA